MKHELSDIDPQKMDSQKWNLLLDLLEHPEKYSETQKDELLGDEEVNELYQQLIETRQSLDFAKSKEGMKMPSIDAEWEKLKDEMKLKEEMQQKKEMSQNAETQQTAKLFPLWSPMRKVAAVAAVLVVSGITFAAIHLVTRSHQLSDKNNTELVASHKDSIQQVSAPQKSNIEEKTDSASLAPFTSSIRRTRNEAPNLGEQVTQSIDSGSTHVPFVSMQTYFPALCKAATKSSSTHSPGSPPVKITVLQGY